MQPRAYWGGYGVTKAGVAALARELADEWENRPNLRVNAVVPGPIRSPMRGQTHPGEDRDALPAPEALVPLYLHLLAGAAEGGERGAARRAAPGSPARRHPPAASRSAAARAAAGYVVGRQHVGQDERTRARGARLGDATTIVVSARSRADRTCPASDAVDRPAVAHRAVRAIQSQRARTMPASAAVVRAPRAPRPAATRAASTNARISAVERQRRRSSTTRGRRRRPRPANTGGQRDGSKSTRQRRRCGACRDRTTAVAHVASRRSADPTRMRALARRAAALVRAVAAPSASASQVATTVSGLSDMLSMLRSTSHCARSGWSDGPCPQMPTYAPCFWQASIAISSIAFTASSRSSKVVAIGPPESRSTPSVSCVMSLMPIEKPSKCSRKRSASIAFDGISHIMITRRPFSPRFRPLRREQRDHRFRLGRACARTGSSARRW